MPSAIAPAADLAPCRSRDLSRYLLGSGVALWGVEIAEVAVPLVAVTTLDASPGQVGMLSAATAVPFVAFGLPAGAWLDRVRRRPVMVATDFLRAVALATVPIAHWFGVLTLAHLWLVVTVVGTASVFFEIGTRSYLKDLVRPGQLVTANARLSTISQTALICGPLLAGWAAGVLDPPTVLAATAAGYVWSAVWLLRLGYVEPPVAGTTERRRLWREIGEGLEFVWRHPVLRTVLIAGAAVNVALAGTGAMLPIVTLREAGWSEGQLGLFLGAGGVGGLAGALLAPRITDRVGVGRAVLLTGVVLAPAALVIPRVGAEVPGWLAAIGWAAAIFKVGFDAVMMMSFRQSVTPANLMGRVNATMRVVFSGAVALGAATAGLLAELTGPRTALLACSVAFALVWIPIATSPIARLRTLSDSTDDT